MEKIWQAAQGLQEELVVMRRDLHKHPESGWTEFRTASIVVKELEKLGYAVAYGAEVVDEASMMGVPSEAELQKYMERKILLFAAEIRKKSNSHSIQGLKQLIHRQKIMRSKLLN